MADPTERIVNVPNALLLYRLVMAPVNALLAIEGLREAFAVCIVTSLLTDILDGRIARFFHS